MVKYENSQCIAYLNKNQTVVGSIVTVEKVFDEKFDCMYHWKLHPWVFIQSCSKPTTGSRNQRYQRNWIQWQKAPYHTWNALKKKQSWRIWLPSSKSKTIKKNSQKCFKNTKETEEKNLNTLPGRRIWNSYPSMVGRLWSENMKFRVFQISED